MAPLRILDQTGYECLQSKGGEVIDDFILRGERVPFDNSGKGEYRDIDFSLKHNRDYHYPRIKKTICDFGEFRDKTVIIACPGTSLSRLENFAIDESKVKVLAINAAARYARPHAIYMSERHAKINWVKGPDGNMVDWVPDIPVITCPDASTWIADMWPDEKRYYEIMHWGEVKQDPRACKYIDAGAGVFALVLSPVMATHAAVKMGAKKIIYVGMDFSMDQAGNYYPGENCRNHPNNYGHGAAQCLGIRGSGIWAVHPILENHASIMESVCYWVERTARIPCINASAGGIFGWRPMSLREAIDGQHEPIVDFKSGEIHEAKSTPNDAQGNVRGEVEGSRV